MPGIYSILGGCVTMEGRNRSPERNLGPAALSPQVIPEGMPGSAGTPRAYRNSKHTRLDHLFNILQETDNLWNVYASPDKRFVKNLSIYKGSDLYE